MKDPQCVSNCTSEGPWEGLGLEGLGTEVPLKDTDLVLFPWGKARGPPGLWRGFRQDGGWGERTISCGCFIILFRVAQFDETRSQTSFKVKVRISPRRAVTWPVGS